MPLEFRLRVLEYSTEAEIMKRELLPGGRWLLICSTQNQYFLHDLHMSSSQPQELANPGQFDLESGTLDELTSLKIWVDNSKENFCFHFVVWNRGGSLKRELDWIGKFCNNNFFPEGDVTRMFVYETNIFEDEGEFYFDTKTIYSTRSSLRGIKPSVALSEKYIIEAVRLGQFYDNTEWWKLVLIERSTNDPKQAVTVVRLRKKDNAPIVSAPLCLQQFLSDFSFLRKNFTSQQMTLW